MLFVNFSTLDSRLSTLNSRLSTFKDSRLSTFIPPLVYHRAANCQLSILNCQYVKLSTLNSRLPSPITDPRLSTLHSRLSTFIPPLVYHRAANCQLSILNCQYVKLSTFKDSPLSTLKDSRLSTLHSRLSKTLHSYTFAISEMGMRKVNEPRESRTTTTCVLPLSS